MRKFKVSWRWSGGTGSGTYEAKNQTEALMKVMKTLSPDGIHAPQCVIKVIPIQ